MSQFDCKPGPIRDRVAELQAECMQMLERVAADAQAGGQLRSDVDVDQLAFDFEAALLSAYWYTHLFSDTG